jgi:hypothetical protein
MVLEEALIMAKLGVDLKSLRFPEQPIVGIEAV